jgi:PmbA protein
MAEVRAEVRAEVLAELGERAAQALEVAKRAGADDAWATASRSRGAEVEVRDGRVEKAHESTSRGLSLRLYVDGRYGTFATTDLRPDALTRFVADAVAMTRALEPDPFRQLPDPALFADRPTLDLELVDPAVSSIDAHDRVDGCMELWEHARQHPRLVSATASVSHSHGWVASVSTHGFEGTAERTSVGRSSSVTLADQGDARPTGSHGAGARHLADLPPPAEVGAEALRQAARRLGASQGPTRRATVVVEPRAAGRLLGMLLGPANARAFAQQRSFWRGRLGEPVLSARLEVVDDPLIVRGLSSRRFDGEGISARRMRVLEGGALRTAYVDTYYGRKIGAPPTTGASSNLVVGLGARGLDAIVADVSDGLLVTGWLGGNSDATTGDFSLGLRGHWIERGEVGRPVQEMNVTGNLLALFASLVEVGDDPLPHTRTKVPTLVFEGVQLSGG